MGHPRDTLELVGACPLFAGLAPAALRDVAAAGREVRAARRETFFRQGDSPCALHLLAAGEVALKQVGADGAEVTLRLVGPGEAFALVCVLDDASYPATAEALTECRALAWDHRVIAALMDRHAPVARAAVDIVLARVRELEERFREVATQRVAQRLARALLRLVGHAGRRTEAGVLIDLPLSREELASMTGTTLFTVSRLLADWEQRGIVASGRETITVRSPHGLVAIAEDLPELPPSPD